MSKEANSTERALKLARDVAAFEKAFEGVNFNEQPAQQALDKKAENARELGLDYEPAQRKPLTDDEVTKHFQENVDTGSLLSFADGVRFAEATHGIAGDK